MMKSEEKHSTLSDLLDSNEGVGNENEENIIIDEVDENLNNKIDPKDLCIDCLRMPKELYCKGCQENFCRVCYQFAHRGGKRKDHQFEALVNLDVEDIKNKNDDNDDDDDDDNSDKEEDIDEEDLKSKDSSLSDEHIAILKKIKKNIKFIPIRLNYDERQLLKLLEAALSVSEYTDKVDIISYTSKTKRIITQLKEMCSILAGLVVSSNMKVGQKLIENKNFVDNADWYKSVFEIGRRYKVMNPERMRDTYGKLCYIIMDSRLSHVKEHMEFDLYKPILTIERFLSENAVKENYQIFNDPLILSATADIRPDGKSRNLINKLIKQKEKAIEILVKKYCCINKEGLNKEQIRMILYSIGDFNSYTNKNRIPVINMLNKLDKFFTNSKDDVKFSLGIRYGYNGARLTHNHEKQYLYVKQALGLWNYVMRDLIELWYIADDDLFDGSNYRMADTGQGFQRIKSCPKLYKKMYSILSECQSKFDYWVGIPVIHLGDDAVPNALFFLDKYIQIPTILIPIDKCIELIPNLAKDEYIKEMFEKQFGSIEELQKVILCDYFKHGFDGSGADNYYFAGSCVDASSTSSCEFCNNISKKDYYKVFLLSGFTNFNGEGY
ncbi:hypothetical protein C6P40_001875 [Pichia californica]|uniref:B box-type domain-containing protein n=1 Tax=Pichia californica TaxID=460514 RepID=A0A9P6WIJ2_9ASCO|nr:hypothetical protein C6P42_001951 [[Candida] californica]KAG0687780.1 hypothetical protein C6P40_001875 [[Candida] californica]